MSSQHRTLILISMDLVEGQQGLKSLVSDLDQVGKISGYSSVYKKYLNARSEDLNSELVMVVKMETEQEVADVFKVLNVLQAQHFKRSTDHLTLLAYDQQVRLYPGENLPHPLLHNDSLTLRCAAEAWGAYEHPVLGQTLNELVRSNEPLTHVEFYAQGRGFFPTESL